MEGWDPEDLAAEARSLGVDLRAVRQCAAELSRLPSLTAAYTDLARDTQAFGTDPELAAAWRLRTRNTDAVTVALATAEGVDALFSGLSRAIAQAAGDYTGGDDASAADISRTRTQAGPAPSDERRPR